MSTALITVVVLAVLGLIGYLVYKKTHENYPTCPGNCKNIGECSNCMQHCCGFDSKCDREPGLASKCLRDCSASRVCEYVPK
jgi:hypothetical protein